jgi:capsular exopolysaccharide synthesis family protein
MSRIDEALARAGNADFTPAVPPASNNGDAQFPSEEGAEPSASTVADASQPRVPDEVIDGAADMRQLPGAEKLAVNADHTSTEQYRRLAARLHLSQMEHGTRIFMVTSALPGEGKTLTATNLALTLAESYKRQVLLIDADLRRPWVHEMFQLPNLTGLNDGLKEDNARKVPLLRLTDHLTVLTAGRPDSDPMSVLSSNRIKQVLAEAGAQFDMVILDTPPVALLTDAHLLASLVDAVLLVVEAGSTPLAAIKTAVDAVGRDRILGVLLNRADDALTYDAYHAYYSGGRYAGRAAD